MYQIENFASVLRARIQHRLSLQSWHVGGRNVFFLGLTSFFTDISSEMVATVLPLYIIFTLHLSPLQFGFVDGLYQGATVIVRLVGGILADRWQRYKTVAIVGYGLSAVCRLGMLFIGASWGAIATLVMIDRTGKSIRTPVRDTLIVLSTKSVDLATAFGVHRALDTAGAMIGPLVAYFLLNLVPGAFDAIFVVSFCFAVVGLCILVLFVENRRPETQPIPEICHVRQHVGHGSIHCPDCRNANHIRLSASIRATFGLFRIPRFAALTGTGILLGLTTISDGFVFLNLQRQLDLEIGFFPLLYVITSFVYMLLAVPAGRFADAFGRGRVFVAGHVLLLVVYLILMMPNLPSSALFASLPLLGAYYAATDGVLMALSSTSLPAPLRASGLALLGTAIGLARLCSSIIFGLVWSEIGAHMALVGFGVSLLVAILVTAIVLRFVPEHSHVI
jgi:MFS family permease